jgi:hypothetical protein
LVLCKREIDGAGQLGNFRGGELPVVPFFDCVDVERSQLHALHLFDSVADGKQISAQHFAPAAGNLRFVPGIGRIFSCRVGSPQGENFALHGVRETSELHVTHAALHFYPQGLRQERRRLQHAAGKIAIVGQKYDAAGGIVETPDGKNTLGYSYEKIAQRAAAFRVR